jgi:hypothetical protein
MNSILLGAEKVIIPIEVFPKGERQVSFLVTVVGDTYTVFILKENEKDVGPVKLIRSYLTSDSVKAWLSEQEVPPLEVLPKEVRITEWSFWHKGQIETVISGITMLGADGRTLRLCREGAPYPYGLLLKEGLDAEAYPSDPCTSGG